jgi:hypothetical protein
MDFDWVYGTLFRNAGWTWFECRKQPAFVVFKFLEHLSEYPPSYVIDAALHLKQPSKAPREEDRDPARQAMASVMGGAAQLPDHFKNIMEWEGKQVAATSATPNNR